jgi:hypothetical protein
MLNVLDAALVHHERVMHELISLYSRVAVAESLEQILIEGGSAWTVSWGPPTDRSGGEKWPRGLRRRLDEHAESELVRITAEAPAPAPNHLSLAASKIYGRFPDPGRGYQEVIKAIESVLQPIVSPDDDEATLGKMVSALRDKPTKWKSMLGRDGSEDVDRIRGLLQLIWRGDSRHAESGPEPREISQQEAELAFMLGTFCVGYLICSGLKRVPRP